jgi:pimeloyl-ACP methyl ester carboxylesterase
VRKQITLGSRELTYLDAGSGEVLVLLHAFPLNADMWEPQLDQFPHWRVIAPDLRGFGTAEVDGRPSLPASMDDFAADVVDLLDRLKIKDAVIGGLSMGGYITFALLQRARAYFRGLILADTRPGADSAEAREGRVKMQALADQEGAAGVARNMLPKLLGDTTRRTQPALVERVADIVERTNPSAIKAALACMMTRPDSTPLLSEITVPTLILVGDEDTVTPRPEAEAMHRRIAGSRLAVIPQAGHLSNLEKPDEFTAAVRSFLQEKV